jgi:3-carboxy-cis,cis-muconate cycloisomerase
VDVEAALAVAQAECGVIPAEAAAAIEAMAQLDALDAGRIATEEARTGHLMMPLVSELSRAVAETHGGWVHWGATTQNIQQAGDALGIRLALRIIVDLLVDVLEAHAELADTTADMLMAGRTHSQQAVPITFGFKVAAWADATMRHLERVDQLRPRLFIAMSAGAAGTFAAMGAHGRQVQDALARGLSLQSMPVPARSIADPFAELVCTLGMLSATNSAVAEEITRLMAIEFGEVSETLPAGDVGSSTMPQKRNAKLCMEVVSLGAQTRAVVPVAMKAISRPTRSTARARP